MTRGRNEIARDMRYWILFTGCLLLAIDGHAAPAPTSQPAGNARAGFTITGKVTAASEVPLSEMVVFLEHDGSPPPEAAQPALPTVQVSQKGAKFAPALTIVSVGQTVDFLNDEDRPVEHNVFSNAPAKKFDLGLYPPQQHKSVTFDKPGAVLLYCSIHRFMDGVVYVCPTRYHSRVAEDGTYRIENVPPGKYKLRTWQRRKRFPEKTEPVELGGAGERTVNLELRRS